MRKKDRLTESRKAELAIEGMIRKYYADRGLRISRAISHLRDGYILVRFPGGGPKGLRRMRLSPTSISEIELSFLGRDE